jgi:hypothetical protein
VHPFGSGLPLGPGTFAVSQFSVTRPATEGLDGGLHLDHHCRGHWRDCRA